jgi:hypothetical protein
MNHLTGRTVGFSTRDTFRGSWKFGRSESDLCFVIKGSILGSMLIILDS